MMATRWMAVLLSCGMAASALALSSSEPRPPSHFEIGVSQVAQLLSQRGVPVANSQVSLLANVVATMPQPALDVASVEAFGDRAQGRTLVKLVCREPRVCLPFYAVISSGEVGAGPASIQSVRSVSASLATLKPEAAIAVRAGARATLLMDDERMHIRMVVVAVENGIAGHTIRVASPDHKQFYEAKVIGANLLRRSL